MSSAEWSFFAPADQLEMRLAEARGRVDQITPSLLARAFAGKLVPQDPTAEPVAKLLERLKANHKPKSQRIARVALRANPPRVPASRSAIQRFLPPPG